ncbi:hypothetical protein G6M24_30825 [Agrobacterium tumefaciens]|nr:hypothetical protein [Agrobacterium tumefaciens]
MSLFSRKKAGSSEKEVRQDFDPVFFNGARLKEDVDHPLSHLANLLVHSEIRRLDTNDRLDQLIDLQRETLETQKAILDELRKR